MKQLAQRTAILVAFAVPHGAIAQEVTGGLIAVGPATVSAGPIERHKLVVSVPVRHAQRGIVKVALSTPSLRMSADTQVYGARFGSGSESLVSWCGKGQKRATLNWSNQTICYVETPDGQATLAEGISILRSAPSWFVSALQFPDNDSRFARSTIEPDVRVGPIMEMRVLVGKIQGNRVTLYRQLKGEAEPRTETEVYMGEWVLDLSAPRTFSGLEGTIEMRVQDAKSVTARLIEPSAIVPTIPVPTASLLSPAAQTAPQAASPPRAKPTDFVVQGLFLYPDRMQVRQGVIANRGVLASGPARLWQTATVPPQTVLGGFGRRVSAFDGLVLQKVETFKVGAVGLRERDVYWCGVFKTRVFGSDVPMETCIKNYQSGGARIESPDPRLNIPNQNQLIDATNLVAPQFQDDIVAISPSTNTPADDFIAEVALGGSNRRTVSISVSGVRGGISESIFFMELPWSADGTAKIPFWTHSLLVIRQIGGVTAQWVADNPGLGPVESEALQAR